MHSERNTSRVKKTYMKRKIQFRVIPAGSCMNPLRQENLKTDTKAKKMNLMVDNKTSRKEKEKVKKDIFITWYTSQAHIHIIVQKQTTIESLIPLYSIPHLSFTMTLFPVKLFRKGLGLTGTVCNIQMKKIKMQRKSNTVYHGNLQTSGS